MATAKVRGLNINYEIIGDSGPAVALVTGGRRGYDEFVPLANNIAAGGYRVFLHDRRNTGSSDMLIAADEVEEAVWADDLYELLNQHDVLPAFVGGSSAGARTSIMYGLRHPEAAAGLLLFRVTGGDFAAKRLPENYYGQFIRAAEAGGMEAVCATEAYAERFATRPDNRAELLAMDPVDFIAKLTRLNEMFVAGAGFPVMGVTAEELGAMNIPTVVIPGNDNTHSSESGRIAHRLIPASELHELPITDQDVDLVPYTEWAFLEEEIVATFLDFMGRVMAGR